MLRIPHAEDHSLEHLDPETLQRFTAVAANPALVSFPRTGSHWLRLLMELLFERPTLVRAFFYFENRDYLCLHTHDDNLDFQRENVIYLHRDPVDTVYSQLCYLGADLADAGAVRSCANQYRRHLEKWLLHEMFTQRKLVLSYGDLRSRPLYVLESLAQFFRLPWDEARASEAIAYVTKDVVSRKTREDDPRVINTVVDYPEARRKFRADHRRLIQDTILAREPALKQVFESPNP